MTKSEVKLIAFYLPQYHPIPENDAWWGTGFTEWTNVTKARPLFRGHYQPHLPADLGFYDLRLPEVREYQAQIAREYGIYGFCYYHYWFNGRRILNRPLDEILESGKPDFPFCLCWANENWTRRWDGFEAQILLKQDYDKEDDFNHIQTLISIFKDKRYIRVDGKPFFLIYKASKHPEINSMIQILRESSVKNGLNGVYFCNVESNKSEHGFGPTVGFDASVEFAPDWANLPDCNRDYMVWRALGRLGIKSRNSVRHFVYSYSEMADKMLNKCPTDYYRIPCITPSWDNSARMTEFARIFHGSSPAKYEDWLIKIIQREIKNDRGKKVVFINAWNEWAEGNHLEPCQKWGRKYLEATKRSIIKTNSQ